MPIGNDIAETTPPMIAAVLAHFLCLSKPYPAMNDGTIKANQKMEKKAQKTTKKPSPASLPLGTDETNTARKKSMNSNVNSRYNPA